MKPEKNIYEYLSSKEPNVTYCKLDDGGIVEYDVCSSNPNAYDPKVFKLIGKGVIHSINGKPENSTMKYYFFVRVG